MARGWPGARSGRRTPKVARSPHPFLSPFLQFSSKTEGTESAGRLGRRSGCPRRAAWGVNLDGPGAPTPPPRGHAASSPRGGAARARAVRGAERTQPLSGSAWLRIYLTLTQSTQQMAELRGKRPPRCFLSFAKSSERASFGTRRLVPVKRARLGV